MQQIQFNIALLPADDFAQKIMAYSQQLSALEPKAYYVLGESSLPHVTVSQFACSREEAEETWKKVRTGLPASFSVKTNGLYFKRSPSFGDMVGITVVRSALLEELQQRVLEIVGERQSFMHKLREDYDPHMTLLVFPRRETLFELPIPANFIESVSFEVALALGESGPSFQFARKILS